MQEERELSRLFLVEVFSIIGNDGYDILKTLLQADSPVQTKELIAKSGTPESKFYGIVKSLERFRLVERKVNNDRSVFYNLSPIGKKLYNLSDLALDELQAAFKGSESLLQAASKTTYKQNKKAAVEDKHKVPQLRNKT
jgi:DNA-binding MarR family transcriptional regulator